MMFVLGIAIDRVRYLLTTTKVERRAAEAWLMAEIDRQANCFDAYLLPEVAA